MSFEILCSDQHFSPVYFPCGSTVEINSLRLMKDCFVSTTNSGILQQSLTRSLTEVGTPPNAKVAAAGTLAKARRKQKRQDAEAEAEAEAEAGPAPLLRPSSGLARGGISQNICYLQFMKHGDHF